MCYTLCMSQLHETVIKLVGYAWSSSCTEPINEQVDTLRGNSPAKKCKDLFQLVFLMEIQQPLHSITLNLFIREDKIPLKYGSIYRCSFTLC